jgi:two-component system, OmpR family, phosphate regulon sensor histidine kinase PhoR
MLSSKNYSPGEISFFIALPIAAVVALAIYLITHNVWIGGCSFLITLGLVYLITVLMIRRFVYRKIKIIYKLIYQTKASKREEFYYKNILPQKSIEEVRDDVEKWAEQRSGELELLRSNEAFRKEFLQNLSHELKTPIFAIQGYVDTLINGAAEDPAVSKKFLTSTSRNVERLVTLVDDLDEISKLEAGDQQLNKTNFVVQDLVKEVFDSLSIKADESKITCEIKKGCEVPVTVFADREQIRTVLSNLVDNAIKYGKQNGHIEGSAYQIDGKRVLVEISDNGSGIAEEHLSRIFERFYRTDHARSRKVGGSGLGLAICKHIIEAHNHTIHVRSKVDVGTTFGFTLSRN